MTLLRNRKGPRLVFAFILANFFVNCAFGEIPERRYVFIDGGADNGKLYHAFHLISSYHLDFAWEIYAFEINPNVLAEMPRIPNLQVLDKAIWIKDGTMAFYLDKAKNRNSAGSLFQGNAEQPHKIIVETVDFSFWMRNNFKMSDFVIVNFDIEEAEYVVLEKMLDDQTIRYIDKLFVEFHNDHFPKKKKQRENILKRIRRAGVEVQSKSLWDIMTEGIFGEGFKEDDPGQ